MTNQITVYQGNTSTILCVVTGLADLVGYTATLTIKWDAADATATISKEGTIDALNITFVIDAADNDIDPGHYVYDIDIEDATYDYTITSGIYTVYDGVKN